MNKNTKQWIWIGAGILVILILGIGYRIGYRIQNNLMIGKIGTLSITTPFSNTSVFIDNSQKISSTKDNQTINAILPPGKHKVIVSRDSYYPWTKDIVMPSNGKIVLSPEFVSKNASGAIITQNDPEYWKIKNSISQSRLPTIDSPMVSADKSISVWVENNAIMAKTGNELHIVIQPNTAVNNLSFYKDRSDALMFSTSDSVYMIETNPENTQNFMPIYKGTSPRFIEGSPNYVYIEDNSVLMQVII